MINRSVVIVKAKEPFVNWLAMLPDPTAISLGELNREPTSYLLPEYMNEAQKEGIMRNYYVDIFEEELYAWWQDEKDWPKIRDYQTFKQWFDLEFSSTIFDLDEIELCDEE